MNVIWLSSLLLGAVSVSGTVKEAGTRLVLGNVSVALTDMNGVHETTADEDGHFRFDDLVAGPAELTATTLGHERKYQPLKLKEGSETQVTLYLKPNPKDAYETVVLGKRDRTQISQVTLTRPEITKSPGSMGDPLRALQNLPGVARAPVFLGTLNMRGTLARDSQVMIEGTPMPTLYHMGLGPSVIPDMLIEDIALSPGSFGTMYGGSIAGIADMHLREPAWGQVRGRVSIELGMAQALVEIPLAKNVSLTVAARRSFIELLLAPIFAGSDQAIAAPQFTDYQARLAAQFGQTRLDILFFGSFDNMTFIGKDTSMLPKPQWMFQALQPSLTVKGDRYTNKLTGLAVYVDNGMQLPQFKLNEDGTGTVPADPLVSRAQGFRGYVRDDLRLSFSDDVKLLLGLDIGNVYDSVTGNVPTYRPSSEDPLSELFQLFTSLQRPKQDPQWLGHFAAYATLDARIGRLRLTPGVRLELLSFAGIGKPTAQPRVQASFDLTPSLRLVAASGYYEKIPALETYASLSETDQKLTLASWQSSAGLEWQPTAAITVTATGYFNYLFRDIVRAYTAPFARGYNAPDNQAAADVRADGRIYGGEVFFRHRPYKNFFASLSYSLSRSERHENGEWVLAAVDQTHTLNALASYVLPLGVQVGARFRIASGAPYTPAIGGVRTNRGYEPIFSPTRRSDRLPPYHQLDVRIDKTWTFPTWRFTFYIDIQNVYLSQMFVTANYSFDYREKKPFSFLFPPIPSIGVQGDF